MNYFLYKENFNNIKQINIENKNILLNNIINFSKEKGILVDENILEYNNFMLYLNEKLTFDDIKILESLDLINNLTKYKQHPLIDMNDDKKVYKILNDQYIAQNKNVLIKINQDGENICKLGENILKKFS